jgi:hypothetical protein
MPSGKQFSWATNETNSTTGETTKKSPIVSKQETGYLPKMKPSPANDNWLYNQLSKTNNWIKSFRVANWFKSETYRVTDGDGNPSVPWKTNVLDCCSICFDPVNGVFTSIDVAGETVITREAVSLAGNSSVLGGLGVAWDDDRFSASTILDGVSPTIADISCNHAQDRIAVHNGAPNKIAKSNDYAAWVDKSSTFTGFFWYSVDNDMVGRWVISGQGRLIYSDDIGETWTICDPNLLTGPYPIVRHNRLSGDNGLWVSMGQELVLTSQDGADFVSREHNLTLTSGEPYWLGYSETNDRWISLLKDGKIAVSDDQAMTWRTISDPVIAAWLERVGSPDYEKRHCHIATDRADEWVITIGSVFDPPEPYYGGTFASIDNGETWFQVDSRYSDGAVGYGHDRFVMIGKFYGKHSARLIED